MALFFENLVNSEREAIKLVNERLIGIEISYEQTLILPSTNLPFEETNG